MAENQIAKVAIDSPLPQLDHFFDYLIPSELLDRIKPGVRVRVPFRNRRVDGFVIEIVNQPETTKKLSYIENLVSDEAVLIPEILKLAQTVAFRNVGTLHDVLRAAIPPRHARAEKAKLEISAAEQREIVSTKHDYLGLDEFLYNTNKANIAIVNLNIEDNVDDFVLQMVQQTQSRIIIVVPDQFDCDLILAKLVIHFGKDQLALITSQQSAEQRYLQFLKVLRGVASVVIGTRSAVFAPLRENDLIIVIDDGDDLLTSPIAPYWNARDVALWRSEITGAKVMLVSRAQSIESAQLIAAKQAIQIVSNKPKSANRITVSGDDYHDNADPLLRNARIPPLVFSTIRAGLTKGSVLVSVPRRGYLPTVACAACKKIKECLNCKGAISVSGKAGATSCLRCGAIPSSVNCTYCGSTNIRAITFGAERTAEEFGKAFAGELVKFIQGENRTDVAAAIEQGIYVTTAGMEPQIKFANIVVLDTFFSLSRPEGNSRIRFIRHLFNLLHLLSDDGKLVIVGEISNTTIQNFIRLDQSGEANQLLTERIETRLNPYSRTAEIRGDHQSLAEIKQILPDHAQVWGPVAIESQADTKHQFSILLSVPKADSDLLVKALKAWVLTRSANRRSVVAIRIDPANL